MARRCRCYRELRNEKIVRTITAVMMAIGSARINARHVLMQTEHSDFTQAPTDVYLPAYYHSNLTSKIYRYVRKKVLKTCFGSKEPNSK